MASFNYFLSLSLSLSLSSCWSEGMCPCVIKFNSVKEFTLGFRYVDVAAIAIKYCEESFDGSISYCSNELRNT